MRAATEHVPGVSALENRASSAVGTLVWIKNRKRYISCFYFINDCYIVLEMYNGLCFALLETTRREPDGAQKALRGTVSS
jgi:hypothetical protein